MGTGIRAGDLPAEAQQALDNMKDQLIIVLVKRLGGKVVVPIEEIDGTGQDLLSMELVQDFTGKGKGSFTFVASRKS